MNIFRLGGDMFHLFSFLVLFLKMHSSKSVAGISLKTQQLYVLVFITRYLDVFWNFMSLYNTIMKILFITFSLGTVWMMTSARPQCSTYSPDDDSFPSLVLLVPCAVLGVLINQNHADPFEWLWAFSIYLESVAIIPQLFMLQKLGECENLTSHYVAMLGMYRLLYVINWIYRYTHEYHYSDIIVWVAGVVQTALYMDFFLHYFQTKKKGINNSVKIGLPV